MDNEIINNSQTTNHSSQISDPPKHETRSKSSVDTIDKEQLVTETKQELDIHNTKQNSDPSKLPTANPENVQGGIYDPNRIPASIFTSNNSKPETPMNWSVASNESLFSIHMGNNSFSKEQFYMMFRSGEVPKLDFDQPMYPFSGSNTPPLPPENFERTSEVNSYNSKLASDEENVVVKTEVPPASNTKSNPLDPEKTEFGEKNHADELRNSCSSTQSFQFPLLEVGKNSMKGVEKPHSGLDHEQVGQQTEKPQKEPKPVPVTEPEPKLEPQPQAPSTPPKRATWLSFLSCCSAAK